MSHIRAIWMDIDQTLLDFDGGAHDSLQSLFAYYDLSWKEEYFAIFLKVNAGLWDQIEEGKLTHPQLKKIRFTRLFEAWNLPKPDDPGLEERFTRHLYDFPLPMQGAREGLIRLKEKGIPVFAATNGPLMGQSNRLELVGMRELVDDVYSSQEIGFAKPDLRFFEECFQRTQRALGKDILREQILMIGDSWKTDMTGAFQFGCPGLWLRQNRTHDPFIAPSHARVQEVYDWKEAMVLLERLKKE